MKDTIERILFEEFPDYDPIKYESVSNQILEPLRTNKTVDDLLRYAKELTKVSKENRNLTQQLKEKTINCEELMQIHKELLAENKELKDRIKQIYLPGFDG